MKEGNKKVSFDIPEEFLDYLQKEADDKEMSLSGLIRLIIKEHLKNKNDT